MGLRLFDGVAYENVEYLRRAVQLGPDVNIKGRTELELVQFTGLLIAASKGVNRDVDGYVDG